MRGFTLTEVLVASCLMATLVAGGLSTWLQVQAAVGEAAAQLDLRERALYAFGTLETELQMAGYFGFRRPAPGTALPAGPAGPACGAQLLDELARAVEIRSDYDLDCAPFAGGAMPRSPLLVIRRASARPAAAAAGRVQWYSDSRDAGGDRLLVDGRPPPALATGGAGGTLHHVHVRAYYLARSSDGASGVPSLRVKSLTRVAGRPQFVDTEVMPGVESMQVSMDPDATPYPFVRVLLGLGAAAGGPAPAGAPRLSASRRIAVRNLAPR